MEGVIDLRDVVFFPRELFVNYVAMHVHVLIQRRRGRISGSGTHDSDGSTAAGAGLASSMRACP